MSDDVSRVKEAVNIVDVIGEFVDLKKAGKNYKGLCPFHKEKTPSFVVSEERGSFMCFGCHESGDVFSFLMKRDNMTFPEALEYLADKAGITLTNTRSGRREKIDFEKFYKINDDARKFFYENLLTNKVPRDYLRNRQISDYSINEFSLGYGPDSWDRLLNHMTGLGHKLEDLLELGLVGRSQKGTYYDVFRNRLIFPIYNIRNRVIGFGGRALGDDRAKYINSPESKIYHKGSQLYGLNLIHNGNDRERIIMVEGYMDVLGLRQSGFANTVAGLGTALTEKQAKLASRYGKKIYLCYDSDQAGIQASLRAIETFKSIGVYPRLIKLEDGMDPDDFIKAYGSQTFEARIREAENYLDFQLNLILDKLNLLDPTSMDASLREISQVLKGVDSSVLRDEYIEKIAKKLNINPMSLSADLNKTDQAQVPRPGPSRQKQEAKTLPKTMVLALKFALRSKKYFLSLKSYLRQLESYGLGYIYEYINSQYESQEAIDLNQMADELNFTDSRLKILSFDSIVDEQAAYRELMQRVGRLKLEAEREDLKSSISMLDTIVANQPDKKEELQEMIKRLVEIELELKSINGL